MKTLFVFYESQKVGELRLLAGDIYEFEYEEGWQQSDEAFAISLSLPLAQKKHMHLPVKSFFEGLLPEGEIRDVIIAHAEEPLGNDFDFLAHFGQDCAGALTVSSEESGNSPSAKVIKKEVTWKEIADIVRKKKNLADVMLNEEGYFFSLAGAQDKIPVLIENDRIFLVQGTPTTHIIKPPNRFHDGAEDSVYNEYFCMKLAGAIGLETPAVSVHEGETSFCIVERYDREKLKDGTVRRLHQQDFCQAQAVLPSQKYEIQGGPSVKKNYQLIADESSESLRDLKLYLRWMFFNLMIGNNDGHSKNLSFLLRKRKISLSPFYDLLSTAIYPTVRKKFAFKIAGQVMWAEIKPKHLQVIEKDLELGQGFLSDLFQTLSAEVGAALSAELSAFTKKFSKVSTAQKIADEVERRQKHFHKQGLC